MNLLITLCNELIDNDFSIEYQILTKGFDPFHYFHIKAIYTLQYCEPNHRSAVTNLTNRKSCDSAHYPSLKQPGKFDQQNRVKANESQSERNNVKRYKNFSISIHAGLPFSQRKGYHRWL